MSVSTFPTAASHRELAHVVGGQPSKSPHLLTRWAARISSLADQFAPHAVPARGVLPRQLRPYRVETEESVHELAHCPRCGADRGVFRRRFPYGMVCADCHQLLP